MKVEVSEKSFLNDDGFSIEAIIIRYSAECTNGDPFELLLSIDKKVAEMSHCGLYEYVNLHKKVWLIHAKEEMIKRNLTEKEAE
jgi:hypothetical protein